MINEVAHEIIAEIFFHCKAERLCLSTEVSHQSRHKAAAITLNGIQLNALPHRPRQCQDGPHWPFHRPAMHSTLALDS